MSKFALSSALIFDISIMILLLLSFVLCCYSNAASKESQLLLTVHSSLTVIVLKESVHLYKPSNIYFICNTFYR